MKKQASATIPTEWGNYEMISFSNSEHDPMPHLALVHENFDNTKDVLVRVHSECITGDLFGSKKCDCGEQLHKAMQLTAKEGGVILYLRQEGRGIGLINKLKAYKLQEAGLNTVDANTHLGFEADARQYNIAIEMLESLGITRIKLLTNNPLKLNALSLNGIKVIKRVPLVIKAQKQNSDYLETKKNLMGHLY